jgi:hypothetical protein
MNEVRPRPLSTTGTRNILARIVLLFMLICTVACPAAAVELTLQADATWAIERGGEAIVVGTKLRTATGGVAETPGDLKLLCMPSEGRVRFTFSVPLTAMAKHEVSGGSIVANFDSETPVDLPVEISTTAKGTLITASSGADAPPGLQSLVLALRNYDTIQFRIGDTDFTFEPAKAGAESGATGKNEALRAILDKCESVLQ